MPIRSATKLRTINIRIRLLPRQRSHIVAQQKTVDNRIVEHRGRIQGTACEAVWLKRIWKDMGATITSEVQALLGAIWHICTSRIIQTVQLMIRITNTRLLLQTQCKRTTINYILRDSLFFYKQITNSQLEWSLSNWAMKAFCKSSYHKENDCIQKLKENIRK